MRKEAAVVRVAVEVHEAVGPAEAEDLEVAILVVPEAEDSEVAILPARWVDKERIWEILPELRVVPERVRHGKIIQTG